MENLENNLLFLKNINKNDLPLLLKCLQAQQNNISKRSNHYSSRAKTLNEIGILLSGKAHVINNDYWGNQAMI